MSKSIYLAGPDVFYPDTMNIGIKKKNICAKYGFVGHYPFDNQIANIPLKEIAYNITNIKIFMANNNYLIT